ncbi:transporter substrate-binding domain-containing protein [Actinomadura rubrisoli]|uniref:Transporter substrate-binding domain-containing protein n=1 Tax=Actinomadura rubrisoli TaxID=2530368 RepID=A0A4R5CB20_9ACTN|nr:transporter substrate-binding domain-containing protein [Actinomadura rubrisoli]TDD97138.1 transporter substrate-binding domain-containing protein [Actinomadura rubrisoli]
MSRRTTRCALGATLAALALTASACGGDDGATVQGVKLIKKGALTSCTHLPYPPFQIEQNGKVVGFDVDMVDLVAKRLGVTQKVVDTQFETMRTGAALNAGKCDIVMGGMTIKPDRVKFMDVSKPYFDATQALLAKKGSGITSLEDVKSRKIKIGSQAGTTGEDFAKDKGLDPRSFDNSLAVLDGLRTGQVEVIIEDYPVVQNWLKDPVNAKYAIAANLNTGEQYGFWMRKGDNPKLVEMTDQVIAQAKADGTYKKIYEKWVGPMPKTGGPS